MPIVPIHGHEALRARLSESLAAGRLPQSLLFHGEAGVGKQRLALWLAAALVCEGETPPCGACRQCRMASALTHPDILWVFPRPRLKDSDPSLDDVKGDLVEAVLERAASSGLYPPPSGSEGIYIPTIRMVVRTASVTPALARRKVVIVGDAERMVSQEGSDQAANAFLKLLEEPPPDSWLVLTSSTPGALLPTIRSRVVAIRVAPLPSSAVRAWLHEASVEQALKGGSLPSGVEDRVALAAGAPGRLLGTHESAKAIAAAHHLLLAIESRNPQDGAKAALAQGSFGARGGFSDVLEALERELHGRLREAVGRGDDARARAAARAVEHVQDAKQLAIGNVNPQLITASLLADLQAELTAAR